MEKPDVEANAYVHASDAWASYVRGGRGLETRESSTTDRIGPVAVVILAATLLALIAALDVVDLESAIQTADHRCSLQDLHPKLVCATRPVSSDFAAGRSTMQSRSALNTCAFRSSSLEEVHCCRSVRKHVVHHCDPYRLEDPFQHQVCDRLHPCPSSTASCKEPSYHRLHWPSEHLNFYCRTNIMNCET
jgi:hypothetical protein